MDERTGMFQISGKYASSCCHYQHGYDNSKARHMGTRPVYRDDGFACNGYVDSPDE